ncbi:MAG: hypothetical protein QNK92_00470 [Amylibacter sp.]
MTQGIMAIANSDRSRAGEIYDVVKKIPKFMQLVSQVKNADIFRALRPDSDPGLAVGG